jgi:hypothetical protein
VRAMDSGALKFIAPNLRILMITEVGQRTKQHRTLTDEAIHVL